LQSNCGSVPANENGADVRFCMEKEFGKLCVAEMYTALSNFTDENNKVVVTSLEIECTREGSTLCPVVITWQDFD
jgi:hypothetical protein